MGTEFLHAAQPASAPSHSSDERIMTSPSSSSFPPVMSNEFFQQYDEVSSEASDLETRQQSLRDATQAHQSVVDEQSRTQQKIAHNKRRIQEETDRIQVVSTHWFYGTTALQPQLWFRGGTKGKIERSKTKLAKCQQELIRQESILKDIETVRLPPVTVALEVEQAKYDNVAAAAECQMQMKLYAVKQFPSAQWLRLEEQERSLKERLERLTVESQRMQDTLQQYSKAGRDFQGAITACKSAIQHHEKHLKLKRQALATPLSIEKNLASGNSSDVTSPTDLSPSSAKQNENDEEETRRKMERQRKKDAKSMQREQRQAKQKLQEAQRKATQAVGALRVAFGSIPISVRERHGNVCHSLDEGISRMSGNLSGRSTSCQSHECSYGNLQISHKQGIAISFGKGNACQCSSNTSSSSSSPNRFHEEQLTILQGLQYEYKSQQETLKQLAAQVRQETDMVFSQTQSATTAKSAEEDRILQELRARMMGASAPAHTMYTPNVNENNTARVSGSIPIPTAPLEEDVIVDSVATLGISGQDDDNIPIASAVFLGDASG